MAIPTPPGRDYGVLTLDLVPFTVTDITLQSDDSIRVTATGKGPYDFTATMARLTDETGALITTWPLEPTTIHADDGEQVTISWTILALEPTGEEHTRWRK